MFRYCTDGTEESADTVRHHQNVQVLHRRDAVSRQMIREAGMDEYSHRAASAPGTSGGSGMPDGLRASKGFAAPDSPFGPVARDAAAVRIREAARRDALSHALLLTGGGDLPALARYAAAAFQCTAPTHSRPCGVCEACRKVLRDIHPDVVTVRDEEHKNVSAAVVRSTRQDAWVQPNEGRRKVYLFPDCGLLTEQDQNLLLKVVEEGPPYAAFLFCAENGSSVLQTLRSRCVELKTRPLESGTVPAMPPSAEASGKAAASGKPDWREDAAELCRRGVRRRGSVAEFAAKLERKRPDREELAAMLDWCAGAFAAALLLPYGRSPEAEYRETARFLAENLTKRRLASIIELLKKYRGECAYNVGTGHVLGALAAEWEELP